MENNDKTITLSELEANYSDLDPAKAAFDNMSFEEALAALEKIVNRLERTDTTLDESMELFKQGTQLTKLCDLKLNQAQAKIQQLIGDSEEDFVSNE